MRKGMLPSCTKTENLNALLSRTCHPRPQLCAASPQMGLSPEKYQKAVTGTDIRRHASSRIWQSWTLKGGRQAALLLLSCHDCVKSNLTVPAVFRVIKP